MPIADSTTTTTVTISVPERLILGHNIDWWNEAMVVSLGFTGIFALAVALTTTMVVKLQRQIDSDTKAAFAKYRIDAEKSINEAKAEALNAELALEKYKAPRVLSEAQREELILDLADSSGQEYDITAAAGDEPSSLACQIDSALKSAGWKRRDLYQNTLINRFGTPCGEMVPNVATFVRVRMAPGFSPTTDHRVHTIANFLNGVEIPAFSEVDNKNIKAKDVILIMVGAKH